MIINIFQAFESMIGTMSDTLVLHGDKLVLLSTKNPGSRENKSQIVMSDLNQILNNHSKKFENLERQVGLFNFCYS